MQFHFSRSSALIALLLFLMLTVLALFGGNLGWIRSFVGDVIAVVWVYYLLSVFIKTKPVYLAVAAFAVGAAVELFQYIAMRENIVIENSALRIIVGATPDWLDVFAYSIGAIVALTLSKLGTESVAGDNRLDRLHK